MKIRNLIILSLTAVIFTAGSPVWAESDLHDKVVKKGADSLESLLEREEKIMRQASLNPDDPEIMKQMADLRATIAFKFYRQNKFEPAMDYLHNSLQLDPSHADRWELLGDLSNFIGHPSSDYIVQYAYERALNVDPKRRSARIKLAGSYLSSDRFLKAMDQFEILIRTTEGEQNWEHIALLASIYAMVDEIQGGIQFFQKMFGESGNNQFRVTLAILENAIGNRKAAIKLLEDVVKSEKPDTPLATYAEDLRRKYSGWRSNR